MELPSPQELETESSVRESDSSNQDKTKLDDSLDTWLDEAVTAVSKDEMDIAIDMDMEIAVNINDVRTSPTALDFMMSTATSPAKGNVDPSQELIEELQKPLDQEEKNNDVNGVGAAEEEKKNDDSINTSNNNHSGKTSGDDSNDYDDDDDDAGNSDSISQNRTNNNDNVAQDDNENVKNNNGNGVQLDDCNGTAPTPVVKETKQATESTPETSAIATPIPSQNDLLEDFEKREAGEDEKDDRESSSQNASVSKDQRPRTNTNSTPAKMLRNRFANWKSKAEDALQNNQVLKIAQKNIEETNKKVQKAVENNINIGGLVVGINNINKSKAPPPPSASTRTSAKKVVGPDDVEDDLSYDTGGRSIVSETDSQASSVYIDSSDNASCSSFSDTSSVYANQSPSPPRGRLDNDSGGSRSCSASSRSKTRSPRRRAFRPQTLFRNDSNNNDNAPRVAGATPVMKNGVTAMPRDMGSSPVASYKGRYEASGQSQSRSNILKQLQRRVRVPSPEPPMTRVVKPSQRKEGQRQESQLEMMHRTIPGHKIQAISKSLLPGHYMMLLRPGMLGVNLKQTYLPGHGVYVDFILPGGNAENSGVVCVGDGLVKVGDVDISKGTILDVPGIIAKTKRPTVLVLNGEHSVKLEEMDYLTVAIGVVNRMLDEASTGTKRSSLDDIVSKSEASDTSIIPEDPPDSLRTEVHRYSKQRNNQRASFSVIAAACQQDANLQEILRRAFRICCVDNRRLPFLAAFLSNDDAFNTGGNQPQNVSSEIAASTRLMLYLELVSFRDLFSVASPQGRIDHAKLIVYKFLLSSESEDPLFDLRLIFPVEVLDDLQASMSNLNASTISLDLFKEVDSCLQDSLAGSKFAYFLLSDECARMQAYMRGTTSYKDPSLASVVRDSSLILSKEFVSARNHIKYMMVYLLCQKENDALDKNFDKNNNAIDKDTKRLIGSAGGLSCAIFISRVLLVATLRAKDAIRSIDKAENRDALNTFIGALENFWESFIAPDGGVLDSSSYSNEIYDLIEKIRDSLLDAVEVTEETKDEDRIVCIARPLLQNEIFVQNLERLRNELTHDYYVNHHSKYRAHMLHEWMCTEANKPVQESSSKDSQSVTVKLSDSTPALSEGSISRLMRKLDIPEGVSRHCPVHMTANVNVKKKQMESAKCNFNADFALVFTASDIDENADTNADASPMKQVASFDQSSFQRIASAPLSAHAKQHLENLTLEQLFPATIVSYVMVPPLKNRPFQELINFGRNTKNGLEVSLVNFMAPNANTRGDDDSTEFFYGVSLVFNEIKESGGVKQTKQVVALSLVSERNVIPAMRSTLVKLYEEKVVSTPNNQDCSSLVESLNQLSTEGDKSATLTAILEPYIKIGSSAWIDKPLAHQMAAFERSCIEVLVESLSPVPLSLLLITALLEQKIVFTSNRRSTLVSTVAGLRSLLRPLGGWSHLIVPTAPASLASDLMQYPAPFIIGISLDSKGSMETLKTLPEDVTLVDIDVGRVILTKTFSRHSAGEGSKEKAITAALRSQVLHLAESLGNVIGGYQSDSVWRCDSPFSDSFVGVNPSRKVEAVQKISRAFILELTAGINTCCYWLEEECEVDASTGEQNILFDEDRFLHLKQLRSEDAYSTLFESEDLARANHRSTLEGRPILALNLTDFDLVMTTFLRGQSMSSFISSQRKETMPYW